MFGPRSQLDTDRDGETGRRGERPKTRTRSITARPSHCTRRQIKCRVGGRQGTAGLVHGVRSVWIGGRSWSARQSWRRRNDGGGEGGGGRRGERRGERPDTRASVHICRLTLATIHFSCARHDNDRCYRSCPPQGASARIHRPPRCPTRHRRGASKECGEAGRDLLTPSMEF